ncbi:MAG: hypothetical protein Q9221_003204 [Calogaya cf. arnoldii]
MNVAIPIAPSNDHAEYTVDLEYEIHCGIGSWEVFEVQEHSLCTPPVGEYRFIAPWPTDSNNNKTVNYGWNDNVCPQAQVGWAPKVTEFMMDFNNTSALADWKEPITEADYGPIQVPAQNGLLFIKHSQAYINVASLVSEDYLTLNVVVPKKGWDHSNDLCIVAAVIVWVYGGGYASMERSIWQS